MLEQIAQILVRRGYYGNREQGVFIRETQEKVYLVILCRLYRGFSTEQFRRNRTRIEYMAAAQYRRPVETLSVIQTEDGMFSDDMLALAEQVQIIWFLAADTGRIYVFENQSEDFDGLYSAFEKEIAVPKRRFRLAYQLTPVNMVIVIANVIYFIMVILLNGGYGAVYDTDIMLKMGALSYETFTGGRWYELVTSLFLHFGLQHLLNNMVLLSYVGCELEKRIGSMAYVVLYFAAGIAGNLLSLWYYNRIGELTVSAGASGAIFGVLGGLIAYLVVNRQQTDNLTSGRLLFLAVITIYYGLTTAGVDNAAHIGGFLLGIIGVFLLSKISHYDRLK